MWMMEKGVSRLTQCIQPCSDAPMQPTLVKCINKDCHQFDRVKSITPIYLGNGVIQRPQPVCTACVDTWHGDMIFVDAKGEQKTLGEQFVEEKSA